MILNSVNDLCFETLQQVEIIVNHGRNGKIFCGVVFSFKALTFLFAPKFLEGVDNQKFV